MVVFSTYYGICFFTLRCHSYDKKYVIPAPAYYFFIFSMPKFHPNKRLYSTEKGFPLNMYSPLVCMHVLSYLENANDFLLLLFNEMPSVLKFEMIFTVSVNNLLSYLVIYLFIY